MRPTRKIIAEFVGVFLIGSVAGGLVTWSYTTWNYTDTTLATFMTHTNDPDQLIARINKKYSEEYHLTSDELTRIQPDIKELAQAMYQVRHQFGGDVMTTLDKYHQRIAAKLDPEHRDTYVKAVGERETKLKALLLPDQSSPVQGGK